MCSVPVAYKLIAGIRRELLNMFKISEPTLRVSAITCVLVEYFKPIKSITVLVACELRSELMTTIFFSQPYATGDRYGVRAP